MTSEEKNKPHHKHAKLTPPDLGEFGRNEIAILGTACANIKKLAYSIIQKLTSSKVAYVDADHKSADNTTITDDASFTNRASLEYTNKLSFQRLDLKNEINRFEKRMLFNDQHLIILNGNHFKARHQIVIIDPAKNLEKKLEELTDVKLILLKDKGLVIPGFLQKLPGFNNIPVLSLDDENAITDFVNKFLSDRTPPLNGLVLSGGHSTRMKKDKGSLDYHGMTQREYLHGIVAKYCDKAFVSCNAQQAAEMGDKLPIIQDTFLNLGPIGGLLSALQTDPNAAWFTVACDLPYLSENTIEYLVRNRNPSKTATAFLDRNGEFPEPLITIWEPKSYSILLQYLSQGYSCPRKTLINSDIELLKAPDTTEFLNANLPEQYEKAIRDLKTKQH